MSVPLNLLLDDRQRRIADWGETIAPAIDRGGTLYELPLPVLRLRVRDAWDFEKFKVPLTDGETTAGHSQNGVEILIEGQIGTQDGTARLTELEMFTEIEALRSNLDVGGQAGKYSLFLLHDAGAETYRKFKSCSTVRFEYDLSHRQLFGYSILIHAEDPAIYDTGPGL